ncbi:hypothetical protein HDE69_002018 [Pedobacter cryoconitis]|uniref:Uncharacterized protein n=1 Tax=Pedobacter cryoconitis TaxID=188932 RepID=A0A7W9DK89_9SPHI|nr:hypothetical protein [Pedobacter cryoconitis]MBB5620965.1 hypothetical protein [Pedobacter cryoconitis]
MPNKYFKPHETFDLNPHPYDIGVFTGLKNGYEDNLFIKRLFTLPEQEYAAFYQYHLIYYLGKEPQCEQEFFTFVWQIVLRRINFIDHKNPFNSSHALDMEILEKLLHFQKYLRSIDQWNTQKTLPEIITDQHEEIRKQQSEIIRLKEELKKATTLEKDGYINIRADRAHTLYDIVHQLQEVKLPDGFELLYPADQIIWRRMICKFFREDNKEINFNTIHRYFPTDKKNLGNKYKEIAEKDKLFKITPAKKRN